MNPRMIRYPDCYFANSTNFAWVFSGFRWTWSFRSSQRSNLGSWSVSIVVCTFRGSSRSSGKGLRLFSCYSCAFVSIFSGKSRMKSALFPVRCSQSVWTWTPIPCQCSTDSYWASNLWICVTSTYSLVFQAWLSALHLSCRHQSRRCTSWTKCRPGSRMACRPW